MEHIDSIKEQLEHERAEKEILLRKLLGEETYTENTDSEVVVERPLPGWKAQAARLQARMRKEYEESMKGN